MRVPFGDQSLADIFSRRFEEDFPEFRGSVLFLEFPSPAAFDGRPSGVERTSPSAHSAPRPDGRGAQPFAFQNALFRSLAQELPSFRQSQLRAVWQSALDQRATMTFYRPRHAGPSIPGWRAFRSALVGPLAAIVGPDRSTPVGAMLRLQYDFMLPSLSLRDDIDPLVRQHIYDHEAGHALFSLLSVKPPANALARIFEEAVCDSYSLLRQTADGGTRQKLAHFLATTRTYMLTHQGDLGHYTTPTILRTMEEIGRRGLPAGPRALFERAVQIASGTPLNLGRIESGVEPAPAGRQKTREDFYAFFKPALSVAES